MLIKICGVQTPEDVLACTAAGVDWVGINLARGPRRSLFEGRSDDEAVAVGRRLVAECGRARAVGVFADQSPAEVIALAAAVGLDTVQLHGAETPAECELVARRLSVIKALDFDACADRAALAHYAAHAIAFVVDGRVPGSGQTWDWRRLRLQEGRILGLRVLVAGGLRPANVAEAVRSLAPAGVDCASGVRTADGEIDAFAVQRFVTQARAARGNLTRDTTRSRTR